MKQPSSSQHRTVPTYLTPQSLHGMLLEHDGEAPVDQSLKLLPELEVVFRIVRKLLLLLLRDWNEALAKVILSTGLHLHAKLPPSESPSRAMPELIH